ncbi:MAG: type II toxin-antitoxin system VapC family toxin, partial [Coriobacteriia bacterium]|nr:type II toxin-antitoxin system VapC family toxin [Coriobacteriia bacterium]
MSDLVVDASVVVRWLVPHPTSAAARRILADAGTALHIPDLCVLEVANALWKYVRVGTLSPEAAAERLKDMRRAPVIVHATPRLADESLRLAVVLGHPVYDCIHLALAADLGARVVTADARLVQAATAAGMGELVVWFEDAAALSGSETARP